MAITSNDIKAFEKRLRDQRRTSTPAKAQARLIASGAPMTLTDYEEKWLCVN